MSESAVAQRLFTSGLPPRWKRRVALGLAASLGLLLGGAAMRRPVLEPIEGVEAAPNLTYRYAGFRALKLDFYRPAGPPPESGWPTIVAIHGGGWCGGDRRDFGRSLAGLVRRGVAVASVDYRLARRGRPSWPDNLEDVREAVRWLRRRGPELGIDPDRIAALGASAGGHLAALLGARAGGIDAMDRIDAVIDFYGPADLEALRESGGPVGAVDSMLGGPPDQVPGLHAVASPIRHVSSKSAPMLLIHGDLDPTVPLSQSRDMAVALAEAGVRHSLIIVEGAAHGFGLEVQGRDLIPEILEFLEATWKDRRNARPTARRLHGAPLSVLSSQTELDP